VPEYLTRAGAAEYLSRKLGGKITKGSLEQQAIRGTGPKYVMILGRASYTVEWLDGWVEELVQEPKKRPRQQEPLTGQAGGSREPSPVAASAAAVAAA
jgi:hypothetical protein